MKIEFVCIMRNLITMQNTDKTHNSNELTPNQAKILSLISEWASHDNLEINLKHKANLLVPIQADELQFEEWFSYN